MIVNHGEYPSKKQPRMAKCIVKTVAKNPHPQYPRLMQRKLPKDHKNQGNAAKDFYLDNPQHFTLKPSSRDDHQKTHIVQRRGEGRECG